ncbi:unnamed protein product [Urochloa humidicola]
MEGSTGSKFRSIALPLSKETTSVMEMSMVLELPRCNCHHPLMQFHWTSKELQEQRLGCSQFPNLEYPAQVVVRCFGLGKSLHLQMLFSIKASTTC